MKNLLTIVAFHLAFTSYLYPQFSLDKFLDLDWSQDENSIKKNYSNITFKSMGLMGVRTITAIDTLEKFEIMLGFAFKDNTLKVKNIINEINKRSVAENFFEYLTSEMIKKFGKDYKKTLKNDTKRYEWKTDKGEEISLYHRTSCILTIMKK